MKNSCLPQCASKASRESRKCDFVFIISTRDLFPIRGRRPSRLQEKPLCLKETLRPCLESEPMGLETTAGCSGSSTWWESPKAPHAAGSSAPRGLRGQRNILMNIHNWHNDYARRGTDAFEVPEKAESNGEEEEEKKKKGKKNAVDTQ